MELTGKEQNGTESSRVGQEAMEWNGMEGRNMLLLAPNLIKRREGPGPLAMGWHRVEHRLAENSAE